MSLPNNLRNIKVPVEKGIKDLVYIVTSKDGIKEGFAFYIDGSYQVKWKDHDDFENAEEEDLEFIKSFTFGEVGKLQGGKRRIQKSRRRKQHKRKRTMRKHK